MYGVLMAPDQAERPPVAPNNPPPEPMSMAPPPSGEFSSREELLDFQKDWAENQGFAVVIGRSRPNRLWIKCDRGGEYSDKHLHDPENRKRKRKATRLTGCPFNIKATMKKDKIWRCHTEIGEHNHGPSEDLSIHPSLRRMTDEQLLKVNQMTEAGKTPVETLEELQKIWPGIKVLRRDIYNARKKYKTEKELADFANGVTSQQPLDDPNGKIPGPTRTGRWEWLEDGDEVKRKKRKKSSISGTPSQPPSAPPSGPSPAQANLAPELREQPQHPAPTPTTRRQAAGINSVARRNFQQQAQSSPVTPQQMPSGIRPPEPDYPTRSPDQFRHYDPSSGPPQRQTYRPPPQPTPNEPMPQRQPQGPFRGPPQGPPQGQPLRPRGGPDTMPIGPLITPMSNTNGNSNVNANANINNNVNSNAAVAAAPSAASTSTAGGAKHQSGQVLMSRIERMEKEQRDQKAMLTQILGAVQGMHGPRR